MRKILLPHAVLIYVALYHGKDFGLIFLYMLMFVVATNYKYATAWLLARIFT